MILSAYSRACKAAGLAARLALLLALSSLAACAGRSFPPGPGAAMPAFFWNLNEAQDTPRDEPLYETGSFVTSDGTRLALRVWLPATPPRALLLALHGFNDYSKAFEEPGRFWAAQGLAVFAYDQRGFGDSPTPGLWPGAALLARDAADAATWLRGRYPGVPLYLVGESMGGAVALATVRTEPFVADGLVLSAPALWGWSTQPWYQRWALELVASLTPGFSPSGRGLGRQASDNIEMLRALGRDPLVQKMARVDSLQGLVDLMELAYRSAPEQELPLLLLYGNKDEIVPAPPVESFWRHLPPGGRRLFLRYPGGWHLLLRDLEATKVLKDVAAWVLDPARFEPQGEIQPRPPHEGLQQPARLPDSSPVPNAN
jgi:acylglycerol lipase